MKRASATQGSGVRALEQRMWDEARAAAERRWQAARSAGTPVSNAHEEPTLPPGMYRIPPSGRHRTPTVRIVGPETQARARVRGGPTGDEAFDLEPTQRRRAPTRRQVTPQPARAHVAPAKAAAPSVQPRRPTPPPLPPAARAQPWPPPYPALREPPAQLPRAMGAALAQAPMHAPPMFVMPQPLPLAPPAMAVPSLDPPARLRGVHVLIALLLGFVAYAYHDMRGALDRNAAANEKLRLELVDIVLGQTEARARLDREMAAIRDALASRPPTATTFAREPRTAAHVERPTTPARAKPRPQRRATPRRTTAPAPHIEDDPLSGILRGPSRSSRRGSGLEL